MNHGPVTLTSGTICVIPVNLASRNTISDKFTAVRGGLVVIWLRRYDQIYCVLNAYTSKSLSLLIMTNKQSSPIFTLTLLL
jgi:hypothetical protein